MDKRYQVFVSSTYADLQEERGHVMRTLMQMDCIPAGMELFPAIDQEQFEFIKQIIDDCDYYLLIIGGRYGSLTSEGISYTEQGFDYAVKKELKIIALIHEDPGKILAEKSDFDSEIRRKLDNFREKAKKSRLVKFWKTPSEISGIVSLSLQQTIKQYPAIGWVRADQVANQSLLVELNDLRKENKNLQESIAELNNQFNYAIKDIADIDSDFTIRFTHKTLATNNRSSYQGDSSIKITWLEIFSLISPYLAQFPNEAFVLDKLNQSLLRLRNLEGTLMVEEHDFKTIAIQLKAYGLISIRYSQTIGGSMALFWSLTKRGEQLMLESRVIRKRTLRGLASLAGDEVAIQKS